MCLALLDDLGRDVVQEVCGKVEFRTVASALCGFFARRNRSGVVPPLACCLARKGNHSIDQHQHAHLNPRTHERGRKTAERLCDENHSACPDCFDDAIGIGGKAGVLVITREIDRGCFVLGLLEERHHQVPVPCDTTSSRYENESCHVHNSICQTRTNDDIIS